MPSQLGFDFSRKSWGGKRAGAGRKPREGRRGVPHRARGGHGATHPVLATMRAGVTTMRSQVVLERIRAAFAAARCAALATPGAMRVIHFSVQRDHVHLLVEASDQRALSAGMKGLGVRLARAINGAMNRRGRVFTDRFHARDLRGPREVRNALVYVLFNHRKHGHHGQVFDRCSSIAWFDGLAPMPGSLEAALPGREAAPPVARARTWLGHTGWRRRGLVRAFEAPRTTSDGPRGLHSRRGLMKG